MTLWRSTMGAPLTADEEEAIIEAWYRLEALCASQADLSEPVEMLDFVTDVTMACYEVRRAVGKAWNAANARAFPTPPKGVTRVPLEDPKQLHNILSELFGEPNDVHS